MKKGDLRWEEGRPEDRERKYHEAPVRVGNETGEKEKGDGTLRRYAINAFSRLRSPFN
jgi:hypothetical protein